MTIKKQMRLARILAGLSVSERENVLAVTKELAGKPAKVSTAAPRRASKPRARKPASDAKPIREAMKAPAEKPKRASKPRRKAAPERAVPQAAEPDFDGDTFEAAGH